MIRQLVYISTARDPASVDYAAIERTSQRNNAGDAVSGLLLFDGVRFLQVLEGPDAEVEETLARIRGDRRHLGLVVLTDRQVEARSFGRWAMLCEGGAGRTLQQLVEPHLAAANPSLRATFQGFAEIAGQRAA